jgi:hypothetical protein
MQGRNQKKQCSLSWWTHDRLIRWFEKAGIIPAAFSKEIVKENL